MTSGLTIDYHKCVDCGQECIPYRDGRCYDCHELAYSRMVGKPVEKKDAQVDGKSKASGED